MKIALITPGFSASEEDWCIPALLNLVRGLAQEHEVHVFTLRYPHRRGSYRVGRATVHALGGATVGGVRRAPLLWRAIRLVLAHSPFDVVHGCWADEAGFVATVAARRLGVRSVVSLLGGELVDVSDVEYGGWRSVIGRNLTRFSLRSADCITVGSTYLGNMAQHFTNPTKIVEQPLGYDNTLFFPQPRLKNKHPRLLHVGSLIGVKDQTTLLNAFAEVVQVFPSAELTIVGTGILHEKLEQLTYALRITDYVNFCGSIEHDQLVDLYHSADLLVMSSRHESQCMVLLEALACGCPAVGTHVGLFPQLLPSTNVVPIGNAPALANAIIANLKTPLSIANHSLQKYTLPNTLAGWNRIYRGKDEYS